MGMISDIFAKFGLDVDAQSFLKGQLAADAVRFALTKIADVAIAVTETLKEATFGIIEQGAELGEQAKALGLSTSALQELRHAAGMASVGSAELGQSLGILQKNMVSAIEDGGDLKKVFKKLGVDLTAGGKIRDTADVFEDLAGAFARMPDKATRSTLAMKLFGKAGKDLIPLLLDGKEGVRALRQEFQDLHGGFSDEFVEQADEFGDNVDRVKLAWEGVKYQVAEAVLPALMDVVSTTLEWVRANKDLIRDKIKEYVERAVDAIYSAIDAVREWVKEQGGLGAVFKKVIGFLKIFAGLLVVGKVLGFVAAIVQVGKALLGLWTIMLANPLVALIALIALAVGLIATAIINNWDAIKSAFDSVTTWLAEALESFIQFGLDMAQPFIDAGTAVKGAWNSVFNWFSEKLAWVERKLARLVDAADVFGILDSPASTGTRGRAFGTGPTSAPVLGTAQGGKSVSMVSSPTINVVQQPGENGIELAARIRTEVEKASRKMLREATGGLF